MSSERTEPALLIEQFLGRADLDPELRTALLDLLAASYPNQTQETAAWGGPIASESTFSDLRSVAGAATRIRTPPEEGGQVDTILLSDPAEGVSPDGQLPASAPLAAMGISTGRTYGELGLIAVGGMGEVRRVRDEQLNRVLAMKVLRQQFGERALMVGRFLEEAQVTAQLAHPGIPPVHEIGQLPDGRPYFTMKEVLGRTLSEVIRELHRAPEEGQAPVWTQRRVLEVFRKVCQAVAYAHARGVIHCDLKPANVMVAAYGEVLVMDWGLTRLIEPIPSVETDEPKVRTTMPAGLTQPAGSVAGTPAYMPPEQAEAGTLDPRTDVYALGVMLYEALMGERPFKGAPEWIYEQSKIGPRKIPIRSKGGHVVDPELSSIAVKAMNADVSLRYPDAGAMAQELGDWLEGSRKREQALDMVDQARSVMPTLALTRERAKMLADLAATRLSSLPPDASVEEKSGSWLLQDESEDLDLDAELKLAEVTQALHAALGHADVREAHGLLADIYYEQHAEAERQRAWASAAHAEVLLKAHDIGQYEDYLSGNGTLNLVTEPPCEVRLFRYTRRARQLVAEELGPLGTTPLVQVELPVGSYVLELAAPDRPVVRYPVHIGRLYGWHGRAPGQDAPHPIVLPEALAPDEVYVPAGWFLAGGDAQAASAVPRRRVWVDGFVIQRFPVTAQAFFAYLASGEGDDALKVHLRERLDLWRPDWPVVGVHWSAAADYARWMSEKTGQSWRLPVEFEWEKAARGVDGRIFPWGDFVDPAFCHMRSSLAPALPKSVHAFPGDQSPYGVRGLGGNSRDWCADRFRPEGPALDGNQALLDPTVAEPGVRTARGGSWRQPADGVRAATRVGLTARQGHADVGFRLVRSLP